MDENVDCTRASAHWMMIQHPPPSSEIAMLYVHSSDKMVPCGWINVFKLSLLMQKKERHRFI